MKKQTEIFVELVQELINDVISHYANDADALESYAFGWIELDEETETFAIGPNNKSVFHYADRVVKIAEACGMSWYITIGENKTGPCAIVRVF
jgi:hypothetical protein